MFIGVGLIAFCSIAVDMIFDTDRPFAGFIKVSSAQMQQALEKMKP
jgi:hypothetical protein